MLAINKIWNLLWLPYRLDIVYICSVVYVILINNIMSISKNIKQKVYLFNKERNYSLVSPEKLENYKAWKKECNPENIKKLDIYSCRAVRPKPLGESLINFGLGVTNRNKFSVCGIKELILSEQNRRQRYSNKNNLIQSFYARRKTNDKIRNVSKNKSLNVIESDENKNLMSREACPRKIYHSLKKVVKPKFQSFDKIMSETKKSVFEAKLPNDLNDLNRSCTYIQTDEIL